MRHPAVTFEEKAKDKGTTHFVLQKSVFRCWKQNQTRKQNEKNYQKLSCRKIVEGWYQS